MYKLDWSFIYNSLFLISSYLCLVRIRRRDFAVLFADCACFSRFLRVFLHVYFYYSFKKQFQVILPKVQKITKITKIGLKKFHKIICDSVFFIEIFQHFFVFLRLIQIYYFSQQQSSKILFIVICWNKTAQKRNIMCLKACWIVLKGAGLCKKFFLRAEKSTSETCILKRPDQRSWIVFI